MPSKENIDSYGNFLDKVVGFKMRMIIYISIYIPSVHGYCPELLWNQSSETLIECKTKFALTCINNFPDCFYQLPELNTNKESMVGK